MLIPFLLLLSLLLTAAAFLAWIVSRPGVRVAWLLKDANLAMGLRDFDKAFRLYDSAENLRAKIRDGESNRTVGFAIEQGRGMCYLAKDRFADAETHLRRAAHLIEQGVESEHRVIVYLYSDLAAAAFGQGHKAEGEAALAKVAELCRETIDDETEEVAELLVGTAAGAASRNQYVSAFQLSRHATELLSKTESWHQGQLAEVQINLAGIHFLVGEYRQARELIELAITSEQSGQVDENARDNAMFYLGALYLIAGNLPKAIDCLQRSVEFREATHGRHHWNTGIAVAGLAGAYRAYGDYAKSEKLFREAYQGQAEQLNSEDAILIGTTLQFALLLCDLGEYDEADRLLRAVETVDMEVLSSASNALPAVRLIRGIFLLDHFRFDQAIASLEEALQLAQTIYGESHVMTVEFLGVLGNALARTGKLDNAEELLGKSLQIRESSPDASVVDFAELLLMLAELYLATDRRAEAEACAKRAEKMIAGKLLPANLALAQLHEAMADVLSRRGAHSEAMNRIQQAEAIRHQIHSATHPRLARLYTVASHVFSAAGDIATGERYQCRANEIQALFESG